MPTYDYVCTSCGFEIEVMHSVHGQGPSACPKCGSPMKKAIGAPAVHFKGTGWARKERGASRPAKPESRDSEPSGSADKVPGATASTGGPASPSSDSGGSSAETGASASSGVSGGPTSKDVD